MAASHSEEHCAMVVPKKHYPEKKKIRPKYEASRHAQGTNLHWVTRDSAIFAYNLLTHLRSFPSSR